MIRLRTTIIPALVYLLLSTGTTLHAEDRVRPGMWESTFTGSGKTSTSSVCIKPAEAAKSNGSPAMLRAEIEKVLPKGGPCTLKDYKLEGNTVIHTLVCGSKTIHEETTFHGGDSVETTITSTKDGVTHVSQIKGRRTGACKAGDLQ